MNQNLFYIVDGNGDSDDDPPEIDLEEEKVEESPRGSNTDSITSTTSDKTLHQNYPVIAREFICPETETEKVLLVVSLPGGAQNLKIELQDDGFWVLIKYYWPKTMFDVQDLFK